MGSYVSMRSSYGFLNSKVQGTPKHYKPMVDASILTLKKNIFVLIKNHKWYLLHLLIKVYVQTQFVLGYGII